MKRRLKINGLLICIAAVLLLIYPKVFLRSPISYGHQLFRMLGLACILLGQLFRASGRGYKSEHSARGSVLINGGPYALVRNPMYLGIFLIGSGVVMFLFRWWIIIVFLLVFIMRYVLLIFREEKNLMNKFPKEYVGYCKSVPRRIIPELNAVFRKDIGDYLPLKARWVKKEFGTMVAVLSSVFVIEAWSQWLAVGVDIFLAQISGALAMVLLFVHLGIYLNRRTVNLEK